MGTFKPIGVAVVVAFSVGTADVTSARADCWSLLGNATAYTNCQNEENIARQLQSQNEILEQARRDAGAARFQEQFRQQMCSSYGPNAVGCR